jgi:hypothetical protein
MTQQEIERLKSEQPDHKHAFEMKEGGDAGRGFEELEDNIFNTTSDADHDPDYDY